ncbi:MAG TPA: hypothetical protein HPP83_08210 [Candidatus Hydrogenedentes bacterium]|nr:hypothetical protein [Candidatus Hydrogenedentota bacterium]
MGVFAMLVIALVAADAEPAASESTPAQEEVTAKRAVERVLSFVLEAETRVGSVHFDREGKGLELKDVRIANPKGFKEGDAIAAKKVRVEADPKSLFSREPLVHLVEVEGPTVNAETTLGRGSNLKRLMKSADRFSDKKLLKMLPQKEWRIEKGVLRESTVNLSSDFPKQSTTRTLDDIEMTFPGRDGKGIRADEAMVKFLGRLARELELVDEDDPIETLIDLLRK